MHWACARLSDLALFGDLATYFIFAKTMVMHIVTQEIKINVTIRTQGMREPPARASWKTMAGKVTCTPPVVDYDFN